MKIALLAFVVGICGIACTVIPQPQKYGVYGTYGSIKGVVADKDFLLKQKDILRLLMHVHQPNQFIDQYQLGESFDIEANLALFSNPQAIKEFVQLYRIGLLPRNEIFSVLDDVHQRQVIALFHVFYYAKDFETFYKVACWARTYVNEGMFVYALNVAVLHRADCKGLILPPAYEIYPYYFVNHEVIRKAQQYKMQDFALFKPEVLRTLMKDDYTSSKYNKYFNVPQTRPVSYKPYGVQYENVEHLMPAHEDMIKDDYYRPYMGKDKFMTKDYSTKDYMTKNYMTKDYMTKNYMTKDFMTKDYMTKYQTPKHLSEGVLGETVDDIKTVIIPYNYTGWYMNVDREQSLSYYTEDIGLNSYYYYFHADYPFWMGGSEYGLNKDRRGELYFYFHQQLLARYYLERLSNGLGKIDLIDIQRPVDFDYVCTLQYENGLPFPMRPKYSDLVYDDYTMMNAEHIKIIERRIIDAIDVGFVITEDGTKVPLYTKSGIEILGNLIHGNKDSLNQRFYGYLVKFAKILLGFGGRPVDSYKLTPSVLEHYETAMRDPMFYSIYKQVVGYFLYYKNNLTPYQYTDLLYPGVKIESMMVDKLVTYFDYFDVELNNAIYNDFTKSSDMPQYLVKARQLRLNHLPFSYKVNVASDKLSKVVVRVFLGPKYDEFGRLIHINENRVNFVEFDRFVYDLKVGKNIIDRNSRQASHTVVDRTSYYNLYRKVMLALEGSAEFVLDNSEAHCGFPNRLLLPKGKRSGMEYQMFVMITPYTSSFEQGSYESPKYEEFKYSCGIGSGHRFIDDLPLGYPFDRKIDLTQFFVPNMYVQDVKIFNKKYDELEIDSSSDYYYKKY